MQPRTLQAKSEAFSPPRPHGGTGFTLIELLIVTSIIAILVSVLIPALSVARNEGYRAKCLSNLATLGQVSVEYASDHSDLDMMLAVPPWWRKVGDHGFYDYGGGNGESDGRGSWGYQKLLGRRSATKRPLNRYMYGPNLGDEEDFRVFQCPGDFGWVDAPMYSTSSWRSQWKTRPFYKSTGTSYRANAARAARGSILLSISPYFQPINRIPAPSETMLYSESIHWLARWNTTSASKAVVVGTALDPVTIPGWHGKPGRFNIGFVDGHASTIGMDKDGMDTMRHPADPIDPGFAHLWTRGPGPQRWRIDTRRVGLIVTTE